MLAVPALWALLMAQSSASSGDIGPLMGEIQSLRRDFASLGERLRERDGAVADLRREIVRVGEEVATLRERIGGPAVTFLSGVPPSTDSVGYARVAVFAPRIIVDSSKRHDLVSVHVKRVEASGTRAVGDVDLGTDEFAADLPLDQNGALYIVDWSTSEGQSFGLQLRDGAGGPDDLAQPAVSVQVKPLQRQGRFVFVGYRAD